MKYHAAWFCVYCDTYHREGAHCPRRPGAEGAPIDPRAPWFCEDCRIQHAGQSCCPQWGPALDWEAA